METLMPDDPTQPDEPMQNDTVSEADAPANPDVSRWSELPQRFISALVMLVIFLTAEIIGGILFTTLIIAASAIMIREWDGLTEHRDRCWYWIGLVYVTIPAASLIWLRNITTPDNPQAGMGMVLYLILVVAATDIGAYFAGKRIGGPKLAPAISPGKTWAGLAGGVVAAGGIGFLASMFTPYPNGAVAGLTVSMLLAFVAQGGDLFESWLKRTAGVKNSGDLIPGHGGLLDRVDGLLAATVAFVILLVLFG